MGVGPDGDEESDSVLGDHSNVSTVDRTDSLDGVREEGLYVHASSRGGKADGWVAHFFIFIFIFHYNARQSTNSLGHRTPDQIHVHTVHLMGAERKHSAQASGIVWTYEN